MSKLCFDINTSINTRDGITIKELGAILQNFTPKYLYIKNGKLHGVDKVTDLEPAHRLICYNGGFQLMCEDMRTTLYCFRKELADHLNKPEHFREYNFGTDLRPAQTYLEDHRIEVGLNRPSRPGRSRCPNRAPPTKRRLATPHPYQASPIASVPDEFDSVLGAVKRSNPRKEYECHLKSLISDEEALAKLGVRPPDPPTDPEYSGPADPSEFDMAKRFGRDDPDDIPEVKLPEIKPTLITSSEVADMGALFVGNNLKEVTLPTRMGHNAVVHSPDSSPLVDISAQSRRNGTAALVAAIRRKRAGEHQEYDPAMDKGKEEEDSIELSGVAEDQSEKGKLCRVIANILREKVNLKGSEPMEIGPDSSTKNDMGDIEADSLSACLEGADTYNDNNKAMNVSDEVVGLVGGPEKCEIALRIPDVPRRHVENVYITNLPPDLQNAVVGTVLSMKDSVLPMGNLYYNGANFTILVDENNLLSVYDQDNLLSASRLDPHRFRGDYDGTNGSLPIAQFTVHQYNYKLYLNCAKLGASDENIIDVPLGRVDENIMESLGELYECDAETITKEVPDMFKNKEKMYLARSEVVSDENWKMHLRVTVFAGRDCKAKPEGFWSRVLSDYHVLIYRIDDGNDKNEDENEKNKNEENQDDDIPDPDDYDDDSGSSGTPVDSGSSVDSGTKESKKEVVGQLEISELKCSIYECAKYVEKLDCNNRYSGFCYDHNLCRECTTKTRWDDQICYSCDRKLKYRAIGLEVDRIMDII